MLDFKDHLLRGYVIAMLWTESGEDDSPLGSEAWAGDLDTSLELQIIAELEEFRTSYFDLIESSDGSWESAGHDLWLTRNHHGAGFWDREELWGVEGARLLTIAAHSMGEIDVYRGDDGRIYA